MNKKKMKKKLPLLSIIALNIFLLIAVLFLMSHVKNLLYSDVKINLQEIVTQNKDVIAGKFAVELNNLQLVATQIVDRVERNEDISQENLDQLFREYFIEDKTASIFMADKEGNAIFPDGRGVNIAGRNYFKLALAGNQNVSDRIVSRLDGTDIFVISVPLIHKGGVIGTIQKQYTPEEMYNLCSLSLFSSQGNMTMINSQGYILISSQHEEYSRESDNYYRILFSKGNQKASKALEEDIRMNRSGFMETTIDGESYYSAYTQIETLHDWYLITSVTTKAVSPNSNIVILMFYIILCLVVVFACISMTWFLFYKNKQQLKLAKIAFEDDVTGGDTINKFQIDLIEIMDNRPEKKFTILVFDIDNFKYINGFYGFEFGDRILKQIQSIVQEHLGENERIARISGDHFAVLLEEATPERLNQILDAVSEVEDIKIYVSAGIYAITDSAQGVNLMIDKATMAAREVKNIQKKRIGYYSEEHDNQLVENEQIKRSMEQALREQEIIPYYQPKVNVETGEVVGAEALARWRKPDGTLVAPFQFIPVCEKTGLIIELDFAIFEQVLKYLRNRLDENKLCVTVSVNFSRLHLLNQDFMERIMKNLELFDIPHNLVELELTESIIFNNPNTIQDFISELHSYGLSISMDDFGSGHSSLGMLKNLDVDVLKIDREFLINTVNSDKQKIIFTAVANMANRLKMTVVVEGVETQQQVELMRENECLIAQGYLFGRPMEEAAFSKICDERYIR